MKKLFVLSLLIVLSACSTAPTTVEFLAEETCIVVEVYYEAEPMVQTTPLCGPTNRVADILLANSDLLNVELSGTPDAYWVAGLQGLNFDSLGINYYWAIYLNDEMAMVGISELYVVESDLLMFEATPY